MRLFGLEITKVKKEKYEPYNDNCMYCPTCEQRGGEYWASQDKYVRIGYCPQEKMLVDEISTPPCYFR